MPRPSDAQLAIDTALRFLVQRPRSEDEVRQRLRRAGVDEAVIDGTLAQLRRQRLLDDTAFARHWVEQRQTFRPRGARLLRAELARLGVNATLARDVVAATGSATEDAYRAAVRRAPQLVGQPERTFKTRLGQFLARRGFDWDVVSTVVERVWQER